MTHKAIVFDLDDTLYDRRQPFIAACEEVFGDRFSIDYKKLYVARCHYSDEIFDAAERGEMTTEEMYIYRLSGALADFGKSATPEEILYFEERYQYYQKHICLRPGMREFLHRKPGMQEIIILLMSKGQNTPDFTVTSIQELQQLLSSNSI